MNEALSNKNESGVNVLDSPKQGGAPRAYYLLFIHGLKDIKIVRKKYCIKGNNPEVDLCSFVFKNVRYTGEILFDGSFFYSLLFKKVYKLLLIIFYKGLENACRAEFQRYEKDVMPKEQTENVSANMDELISVSKNVTYLNNELASDKSFEQTVIPPSDDEDSAIFSLNSNPKKSKFNHFRLF